MLDVIEHARAKIAYSVSFVLVRVLIDELVDSCHLEGSQLVSIPCLTESPKCVTHTSLELADVPSICSRSWGPRPAFCDWISLIHDSVYVISEVMPKFKAV